MDPDQTAQKDSYKKVFNLTLIASLRSESIDRNTGETNIQIFGRK
jgi:hypothetical protein